MILRDGVAADAGWMAVVLGDWCRATPWMPKLHSRDADLWFAGHLLASQSVRVVGEAGFLAREGGTVTALYLAPAARGAGLGRLLLDDAKRAGPLGLWTFQANIGARRFYAREGLVEVRMTDGAGNDEKLPDVWMEWRG